LSQDCWEAHNVLTKAKISMHRFSYFQPVEWIWNWDSSNYHCSHGQPENSLWCWVQYWVHVEATTKSVRRRCSNQSKSTITRVGCRSARKTWNWEEVFAFRFRLLGLLTFLGCVTTPCTQRLWCVCHWPQYLIFIILWYRLSTGRTRWYLLQSCMDCVWLWVEIDFSRFVLIDNDKHLPKKKQNKLARSFRSY